MKHNRLFDPPKDVVFRNEIIVRITPKDKQSMLCDCYIRIFQHDDGMYSLRYFLDVGSGMSFMATEKLHAYGVDSHLKEFLQHYKPESEKTTKATFNPKYFTNPHPHYYATRF